LNGEIRYLCRHARSDVKDAVGGVPVDHDVFGQGSLADNVDLSRGVGDVEVPGAVVGRGATWCNGQGVGTGRHVDGGTGSGGVGRRDSGAQRTLRAVHHGGTGGRAQGRVQSGCHGEGRRRPGRSPVEDPEPGAHAKEHEREADGEPAQ
jgi:hypothetical protein